MCDDSSSGVKEYSLRFDIFSSFDPFPVRILRSVDCNS